MFYAPKSGLLRAGRKASALNTRGVYGKQSRLAWSLLLMGSLAGCGKARPVVEVDKASGLYKYNHAAEIEPMKTSLPGVSSATDVTTGQPFAPPAAAPGPSLPTPTAVSSDLILDDPNGLSDSGEKAGSWVGALDIYWKLNWIRQELLQGNVPRTLPDVVARQRRHITRILHEPKHLDPDPGHYIPEGVTIPDMLALADSALNTLDAGLEHLQQQNRLEAAGIRSLSVAWNASEVEITQQFARQGLIKTERPVTGGRHDDEDGSSTPVPRLHTRSTMPATRQEEAVALALKYARTYHASPEEMARREFEKTLRAIVRMRDLLHYEFHKPSVPGSSTMVPTVLHQEAGSPPPTGTPRDVQETPDTFRATGDAQQAVIDPFRESKGSPTVH